MQIVKAHAYGNDFLLVPDEAAGARDRAALARALCDRQTGVGADGVIFHRPHPGGAAMQLLNADGSYAEVSGNGVRCLAAWLMHRGAAGAGPPAEVIVRTDAGDKRLALLDQAGGRYTFRAAMGAPEALGERRLTVAGDNLTVVALRVGNPQCVVLGGATEARLVRYGHALATHAAFPEGTNVEFAEVEAPGRVRILIWERGVGPTRASGTGACAAAVAAAAFGGASRDVQVVAPGGTQRVEWREDGLFLTGWAELVLEGRWLREIDP